MSDRTCSPPKVFALDIGGSLAKLVYERVYSYRSSIPCSEANGTRSENGSSPGVYECFDREHIGRRVCLMKFETSNIEKCLEFIRTKILNDSYMPDSDPSTSTKRPAVKVTGGGAYRFRELITRKLSVTIDKEDEMECLILGCIFMLRNIPDELFYYDVDSTPAHRFETNCLVNTFPFLLVNVGSGVSILRVDSQTSYSRVGGSSIGGGTFLGLGSIVCGGKYSFDELIEMASHGDNRKVDMLVRDIYGGPYSALGLSGDVIASSFGMAARAPDHSLADAVMALLVTVSNNIGQLACLYAEKYKLTRILFAGFFIGGRSLSMQMIANAVKFWSRGHYRALFLRHQGYLGAVGAYLKALDDISLNESKTQWAEAYVSSSKSALLSAKEYRVRSRQQSLADTGDLIEGAEPQQPGPSASPDLVDHAGQAASSQVPVDLSRSLSFGEQTAEHQQQEETVEPIYWELDRVHSFSLELLPLLQHPSTYTPDTWDLTQDSDSRDYWITALEKAVERHRQKAEESQVDAMPDAAERSFQFAERYTAYLQEMRQSPSSRGVLTVRNLLSAQQHYLRECGFGDAYCIQKRMENQAALASLTTRLNELSRLPWAERQMALVMGLLSGNVYDWGSSESVQFFTETAQDSAAGVPNLAVAQTKIQSRPWIIDDYDIWLETMSAEKPPYRCVLFFCDNSGADFLLGVLPLAMDFINRGSKVILAANSGPALNDITLQELEVLLRLVARSVPAVACALSTGHLLLGDNGQNSPCLDLRLTATYLVQMIMREKVDLIVIEGMGRAVHTNLYAQFRVDSLKVAVIKNRWLAGHLGGRLYDVVFKFERVGHPPKQSPTEVSREATPTDRKADVPTS